VKKFGVVLFFLIFCGGTASAQSTRQSIQVWTGSSPYHLDSLQYFPSSLIIHLDTSFYRLKTNKIEWLGSPQWATISFRPLPDFLIRPTSLGLSSALEIPQGKPSIYRPPINQSKQLDYQGSFMRNLSLGNRQDLVLQSGFNMQINGTIGDGIQLRAALTDENLPIQPMGNTRQLKEFDRLFIELSKKNQRFTIGDFEILKNESGYASFHKKVQGLEYQGSTEISKNTHLIYTSSISMARGQQARVQLQQKEGNQGPYPLSGANGEKFIIVIAGTEKVFINGIRMERGMDDDYVIDYNSGEITFTGKRLITKDSRIIVEFEYANQTHQSSFITASTTLQKEKAAFSVQMLSQQDTKNPPSGIPYSTQEIQAMATNSSLHSAQPFSGFDPQRPLYIRKDTLLPCGNNDTIYILSGPTESPLYSVRFSYVGEGEGDYILNGELGFEWVAPDPSNCHPRGNYSPFLPMNPPQSHRIISFTGHQNLGKSWKLSGEMAMSKKDLNRFSATENTSLGTASHLALANKTTWGNWQLEGGLHYELVSNRFESLLPFRHPEFYRDWGMTDINGLMIIENSNEKLWEGHFAISHNELVSLQYRLSSFSRPEQGFEAIKHGGNWDLNWQGWQLSGSLDEVRKGNESFSRPKFFLKKGLIRAFYTEEKNAFIENPYSIKEYGLQAATKEGKSFFAGAEWKQRMDGWKANEIAVRGGWTGHKHIKLEGMLTHRKVETSHFLGRWDAKLNVLKNSLISHTHYEIGSGQTPLNQFTFLKVRKGEGTHIWLDSLYNGDGVIQPHEMELAPFTDQADYIRVQVQSRAFTPTRYIRYNQNLRIQPAALLGGKTILSGFSTQSTIRIQKNVLPFAQWNPFETNINDTTLIQLDATSRHVLFYRPIQSPWESNFGKSSYRRKSTPGTGFEIMTGETYWWVNRWRIHSTLQVSVELKSTQRTRFSEFFSNKNYSLTGWEMLPEIHWMPKNEFRMEAQLIFKKENPAQEEENEAADIQQSGGKLSLTYHASENSRIQMGLSAIQIDFKGIAHSPLGFALLNGLSPGTNFLWNMAIDRQLSETLRLNFHYEGRKSETGKAIHVGRAGILAIF
jgi:hypothetical protein